MPYELSRLNLLIVEGEAAMAATWRSLLGGFGIREPAIVADRAKAWDLLRERQSRPDVLICRWEPPAAGDAADGLDLVRQLRRDPDSPMPFLPVIVATATVTRERIREALDAGVNEVLVLPLSPKALETRLREVVEKPRPFVRSSGYFGPDRRRFARPDYPGPFRRSGEES
ncbi:MAG TPA: response regulator [Ferrovibrio sp.]|uniref:response regulator n=1 Tax=Ferrovibrio sp. TaxID=1917215 RepID=UPI002B4B92BF|nr:response regulator [Ferrovibrio sp.]HLT78954.1 response regulator [Ferrovibrio sp.]